MTNSVASTIQDLVIAAERDTLHCELYQVTDIKWHRVDVSKLGPTPSIIIKVSLDEKVLWQNGIFQNSRHALFSIHSDMKMSMFSGHNVPKFRKCKVSSVQDIQDKLYAWTQKA